MSRFATQPEQLLLRYSHISVSLRTLFHKDLSFKTASCWNLQKQLHNGGDSVGVTTKNNTDGSTYDVRFFTEDYCKEALSLCTGHLLKERPVVQNCTPHMYEKKSLWFKTVGRTLHSVFRNQCKHMT